MFISLVMNEAGLFFNIINFVSKRRYLASTIHSWFESLLEHAFSDSESDPTRVRGVAGYSPRCRNGGSYPCSAISYQHVPGGAVKSGKQWVTGPHPGLTFL